MMLATLPATLAACKGAAEAMPPVPAVLQQPNELPFGDRQLAQVTRGTRAALDLLEPRWGRVTTKPYVVAPDAVAQLRQQLQDGLPEGWEKLDDALPPERGELIVYASGQTLFGVLLVPVEDSPVMSATVLSNRS